MKAIVQGSYGSADVLELRDIDIPVVGDHDVLVRVHAAGVVEAMGKNVTRFQPGDEVFGTADGSFAEYASAPEARLARKPANLTFEQAAAVPISGGTALQGLR